VNLQKNNLTTIIICFTKNRNRELEKCLQSIKYDLSYAKLKRARHIYIIDDSTVDSIRQRNRKLASSISIPNVKFYYHGPFEYRQIVDKLNKKNIANKQFLSNFFRPLGNCKWDLGGVRNYALLLLAVNENFSNTAIFLDDDIQIQPICYGNKKCISSIELMENEVKKRPNKIVSGSIEIIPDSSSLWRIADYQLNLAYALSLKNRSILNKWMPSNGTFKLGKDRIQNTFNGKTSRKINSAINYKDHLHNPFDYVKQFPVAGGFLGFATKHLIRLPFPRTYNEDYIWAIIANFEYGYEYKKIDSIGFHVPSQIFNMKKHFIKLEEFGELFFYGIYLAMQLCNNSTKFKKLLHNKWYWQKIIVERKLELGDLPEQNFLLKSMIQNLLNNKEHNLKDNLRQTYIQLEDFDKILNWIENELELLDASSFIEMYDDYWRNIDMWGNLWLN
jgi:hypothetical protein